MRIFPVAGLAVFLAAYKYKMAECGELSIPTVYRTVKDPKTGSYVAQWNEFKRPGVWAVGKWKLQKNNSNIPTDKEVLNRLLPIKKVNVETLATFRDRNSIQVTWIGHATVYVQMDGCSILTDPVFEEYCGPEIASMPGLGVFAYWRYRSAACKIQEIEQLDAVIISHNHYDHLCKRSVRNINSKHPRVRWFVPVGLGSWFTKLGCKDVVELEWWQDAKLGDVTFTLTPAQHWCQRAITDLNQCLWGSWVIKGPTHSFFFAGDTGYDKSLFQVIGDRYGPFDLSAIPIGAYEPRFIMEYQHVDPSQAVQIHDDIKSKQSIGIHWGTYALANEYYLEPPNELERCMKASGHDTDSFMSLNLGETWIVGQDRDRPPFMSGKRT